MYLLFFFFFQAEDGIRALYVAGVQTCALPISRELHAASCSMAMGGGRGTSAAATASTPVSPAAQRRSSRSAASRNGRSEEHTSELQSRRDLVCRLLLEKKKQKN